ncbi:Bug family tripartite tricarboxylate transporter substrate binding protein [Rhodovarius crocodyli]|nr:tripartite tricarboxylate transporter substrate binding protein [Rhodovarius crocodyli]
MRRRDLPAAAGLLLASLAGTARAQGDYPSRPVRFIVPGPAGGAGDVLGRIVMERYGALLGQSFPVENRAGAGTNIGMTALARSAPDGYTLGLSSIASNAVNKWIYRNMPFDAVRDFAQVGMIAVVPNLVVIPNTIPANNVQEFIAWARGKAVSYGSVGAGSSQHLAGAQFAQASGIDLTHIAYTGSGSMNTDLMEGRTQMLFQSISAVTELVRAGRLKAIAVTGPERVQAFPEVPTLREQGLDIVSMGWFGVQAPAGTPEPIIAKLATTLTSILREPDVHARILNGGAVPTIMTPEETRAFMAAETARWQPVIAATGLSVD